jgi:hypothetical protein
VKVYSRFTQHTPCRRGSKQLWQTCIGAPLSRSLPPLHPLLLLLLLQVPMSQFFQRTIPPEELTLDAARSLQPGSYGAAIEDASILADYITSPLVEACE